MAIHREMYGRPEADASGGVGPVSRDGRLVGEIACGHGNFGAPGDSVGRDVPKAAPGDGGSVAERGTTTAEYAIVTMAAVGFAGLLATILRSGEVRELLLGLVHRALGAG